MYKNYNFYREKKRSGKVVKNCLNAKPLGISRMAMRSVNSHVWWLTKEHQCSACTLYVCMSI